MKKMRVALALLISAIMACFVQAANVAKVGNTEYATIDEAIANWTNGSTLTLLADVTLSDVITLKSTEHHILDLTTHTLTAASGKNAFVIKACGTGDGEKTAITIKADASNPGGIDAGKNCAVYYKYADGGISGNDRPIIKIEGGVITASTSSFGTAGIYTIGKEARKCATLNVSGGTFNCSINGSTKSKLLISGGTFNYSVGSQGDSTALRLISGGKFKTLGFMTADSNNTKFWFGTSMANSNVGLYVDDEGYLVVGGPVITELSAKYKAKASNATKWSSYLAYSSAATYGLFYTNSEAAIKKHGAANVTIWEKPAVTIPENVTGDIVEEIKSNTALKDYTPSNLPTGAELEIELKSVGETIVYDVTPVANGAEVEPTEAITFRLPLPASVTETYAKVFHDGTLMGIYAIQGEGSAKYVEVSSADFSEFAIEPIETAPVSKIGEVGYATFAEALTAASAMTGDVTVTVLEKVTLKSSLTGSYTSIKFVGKTTDAEIYLDVQGYVEASGKKVAFEDLKLSKVAGGYITNAGFMNLAFGIYGATEVAYTSCTFLNGAYASSGKNTFKDCTFYRSHDRYGLWAYGAAGIVVDGCTFADIRGIKMYDEGKAGTTSITVKNTDFTAADNKPAIVLTYGQSVTLEGNTYSSKGVFELDLDGAPNGVTVTSDVPPTCVNDNGACGVLVDGKIYTTVAQAAAVATAGSNVTLLHNSSETVEFAYGVTLNKNGFDATNVTIAPPVAKIGDAEYRTLSAAFAAVTADDQTVTILKDVTENLTGAYLRGNIVTENGAKVTITLTNSDWVYCPYTFVIGEGITLKVPALFYYAGGSQINGTVIAGAYYQRYAGTKLTINEPGSMTVTSETFILRYTDGDANAGIYINGDNNDETIGLKLAVAYFYQGMINAKDANIQVGTYWQTNETDGQGSANLVLDNSTLTTTVNEHKMKATGNSTVKLTHESSIVAAGGFASTGTITIDATGFMGPAKTLIKADMSAFTDEQINVTGNSLAKCEATANGLVLDVALPGAGTEADPFVIDSVATLELFRASVNVGATKYNAPGVWVALGADIDMAGTEWTEGIGDGHEWSFDGNFDGKGYTIKNLTIKPYADANKYLCGGLFGYTCGAVTIKDVILENVTVDCGSAEGHNVGALVGFAYNNGGKLNVADVTVKNVTITAPNVHGVGAIVGYSYGSMGTIERCAVDGTTIKGYSFVGGITGYSYSNATITNCSVKNVTITATSYSVGGIAGIVLAGNTISNCSVDATINGQANVGAIVGALSTDTVTLNNCTATGSLPEVGGNYKDNATFEARVGNKYYTSLADAIAAAQASDTITLLTDIDLNGNAWTPIGTKANPFKAIFDGNGKTISNLKINNIDLDCAGLFGYATGATIKNVNIKNVDINAYSHAAPVVGCMYTGNIENCHVSGSIKVVAQYAYAAGITADGYVNVRNCSVIADEATRGVITVNEKTGAGGITGWRGEGDLVIENCTVKNLDITAWASLGGIAGIVHYNNTVKGCVVENVTLTKTRENGQASVGLVCGNWEAKSDGNYTITVTDNTFKNITINGTAINSLKQLCGSKYTTYDTNIKLVESGNTYDAITSNLKVVARTFADLKNALAYADAGETITLLADIEASEVLLIGKSVTIDGNDHKVTSSASRVFRVTTANTEVTLNNVNMVSSAKVVYPNDVRGISIDANLSNVKLTLNSCSVDFTDASANDWAYAVNISGNGTGHTLTVDGGTYEGANVINAHGANNTVVIKDATLNCTYPNHDQYSGAGIWVLQNQGSSVEATGNTFNGSNAIAFNLGTGTTLTESNNTDNTVRYITGEGTESDPYLIKDVKQLVLFRDSVNAGETKYNAPGKWVALGADIDLAGINWVGIGSATAEHGFMGNFDGKTFKIKNLTITNPTLDADGYAYAGLFSITEGTANKQNTIKNLTIENVTISTTGHIVSAAIAYPYYTIVDNVKVCGNINIKGGDYTAGALAYTRRCMKASNISVIGNEDLQSVIEGTRVVGGVISDIQTNGGLADYSNFTAKNLTIKGTSMVGGIAGLIAKQTLKGAIVKNVTLICGDARVGQVVGSLGDTSTVSDIDVEGVTGTTVAIGATYDGAVAVQAQIGDTFYTTAETARKDAATLAETLVATGDKKGVDAFNTMYLLGGSFVEEDGKLVYDYAFGVSNVTYVGGTTDKPFKVTVAIKDADSTAARKLTGRALVLRMVVENEDGTIAKEVVEKISNPVFAVAADGQVTFDVSVDLPDAGEGKATYFTVKVTDEK